MKTAIVVCLFGLVAVALAGEKYTDRFDTLDVDEIITNDRLLNAYFLCLMDKGNCTAEGTELKKHITDGMQTDCAKCTNPQKSAVEKVLRYLINYKPELWNELCGKYDPKNIHRSRHEKKLKELKQ